jgi:hypothetical protein
MGSDSISTSRGRRRRRVGRSRPRARQARPLRGPHENGERGKGKGASGRAGLIFEPTKPREILKALLLFSEFLIQMKLDQIQMNSARILKLSKQQIKRICRRHENSTNNYILSKLI